MNVDEVATIRKVERAIDVFTTETERYHGKVLQFTGDGAFAAFESVANAAAFAIHFQENISSGSDLRFRAGIHLGEVFEENGRVYGDCINIAQRLQGLAPAGGVLISDLVYRAIRGRADFSFEFIGDREVKNIPEPLSIYRVYGPNVAAAAKASPRRSFAPAPVPEFEPDQRPSIAVLPFRNVSGDPDQHYFSDGVAGDIITSLCKFRHIDVIASGSSFALRETPLPLPELGRQLRARYIAQGSVRHDRTRVRVSIDVADAKTGRMIWAERYDRPLEHIFEIQDEIASLAVSAISSTIENAEQQRWKTTAPDDLRAYGLVLKGTACSLDYTPTSNEMAQQYFERAVEHAPQYARGYAGLSRALNLSWRYNWPKDPKQNLARAHELAVQAVETDPNDARGHAELGFVQLYRREHDRSLACYRKALVLNPNDANILVEYGDTLAHAGDAASALEHFDRAMRLNPMYPDTYLWYKAGALTKLRRFEEAIAAVQSMNNPAQGRRLLACCYAYLGMKDEAQRQADLIREIQPGFSAEHWAKEIVPDRRPEDVELFITGLKAAGL
jgi:TolB-like protein